ncbi:MAG: ribose 1,5-bisphosphate isomerase, partial [Candidatus Altiarchaeota archaeon]|nr:ribose 1,5-bisphosphate isomerase [Candidatus Altiarchaeota archaeon]
ETRPLYQGRKTAKELYQGGVPVKFYVDSAMYKAMSDEGVGLALVGIDALLVDGSVINKVGTGLLALSAEAQEVPFYALGLGLKLDKQSLFAQGVPIEERDPREIWDYPVDVEDPAFETVPSKRIRGIVTELGILPPPIAYLKIETAYDL